MGQIPENEINQIIDEIKAGGTNYTIGKKYNHSPNTIQSIRERVFPNAKTIEVTADATEPIVATLNREDERVIEKAKELVDEEDGFIEEAKNIIKNKREQEIIDKFWIKCVTPKFANGSFLEKETHDRELEKLKRSHIEEIQGLNTKHNAEIRQIQLDHQNDFQYGYDKGKQEWGFIYCATCRRPIPVDALEQMGIMCPDCVVFYQNQKTSDDLMLFMLAKGMR